MYQKVIFQKITILYFSRRHDQSESNKSRWKRTMGPKTCEIAFQMFRPDDLTRYFQNLNFQKKGKDKEIS